MGRGSRGKQYLRIRRKKHEATVKEARKLVNSGVISDYTIRQFGKISQPAPAIKHPEKPLFFLHVSSFKEKENAVEYVQLLDEMGLKAFLVQEEISGVSWFRVYIGEFENEAKARKKGDELLQNGMIDYFKPIEIDLNKMEHK